MNIAIITARGGSKGLPRKNILSLNGVPLIGWTIAAAIKAKNIDRVFVSTEDDEIAKISLSLGAEIIERPSELASDTATSASVVQHSLEYLIKNGLKIDAVALLQPTSPLRTEKHINSAFEIFNEKQASLVISVFEPSFAPTKAYLELENGSISGLYNEFAPYMRRQDLPRAFQPNGAIYIFKAGEFEKTNSFPTESVYPMLMERIESVDIDTLEDLQNVENYLKGK